MTAVPVRAVLFDLHCTLVDQGSSGEWLDAAVARCGQQPGDRDALGAFLDLIWEHARRHDPGSERDLDPARHRAVFVRTMADAPGVDDVLVEALYASLLDPWIAYDDAVPVLSALRSAGMRVALVSNIGVDVTAVLERGGLAPLLDAVVTSHDVGVVKPDPRIFQAALSRLGAQAHETLMVGDNPADDTGGSVLGIRTLVLPRTRGPVHGLGLVARVCGVDVGAVGASG